MTTRASQRPSGHQIRPWSGPKPDPPRRYGDRVDEQVRVERGRSFDGVAEVYARSRPTYPVEAVRWLVGSTPSRVLDLGAGTGRLSEVLLGEGHRVLAVDPSLPMLAHLVDRLACPAVAGTAEHVPVRGGVFDAVTVGQAYHWFDTDRAVPEIARVLRPGGVVATVWHLRDETVPWVRRLSRIIGSEPLVPEPGAALGLSGLFGPIDQRRFRIWQRLDRQRLLDLVSSRSYVATLGPKERERMLAEVGALYDESRGDTLGLRMPYNTMCFRARRV